MDFDKLKSDTEEIIRELIAKAGLKKGDILLIGCSTSEVIGSSIGTNSSEETASVLVSVILPILKESGIFIAAQCCEHLNRAIIIERQLAERLSLEEVNVVPAPKAGGSFATYTFKAMENPVAVEHVRADGGLDIGGTLIGMNLKEVAVPLRLKAKTLGCANIIAARTRPKFIGGERAHYNDNLK
ncbi:MAG: TIGR01440 family protein [Oscillospiraceae bacterium]